MRITGGRLRGRILKCPFSGRIRPTSDRLRETIFNILIHAYGNPVEGARVLDVFAGTGAMGFDALSRGACFALFVEQSAEACAIIRANVQALGVEGGARVLRRDARKPGFSPQGEKFDLVFLDPPYGRGLVPPALAALREGDWLSRDGFVVIEELAAAKIELPDGFAVITTRRYSDTQIMFSRVI
jgi:16S rRNA (guanine966-N2)-methyltransferase